MKSFLRFVHSCSSRRPPASHSRCRPPSSTRPGAAPHRAGHAPAGTVHLLPATLETTQWGWFDNAQPPVLRVSPGDTVVMETMMHSHNQIVPARRSKRSRSSASTTPAAGALLDGTDLRGGRRARRRPLGEDQQDRAALIRYEFNVPGMFGEFPKDFADGRSSTSTSTGPQGGRVREGHRDPLRPFPGTIGVARAEPGKYSTVPPGPFGGNMDIRELTEGTTLYVPVFVPGALLWSGDSHAAQGNGEVNLTALETAFKEFNITLDIVKSKPMECRASG